MSWVPVQGEEVEVRLSCGFFEKGKYIQDNNDGSSVCRVGSKRETVQNCNIYECKVPYKKVKQEEYPVKYGDKDAGKGGKRKHSGVGDDYDSYDKGDY